MKNFSQNTDSNIIHSSSENPPLESSGSDVTQGSGDFIQYYSFLRKSNPLKNASEILPKISNPIILEQTNSLLMMINTIIGVIEEKTGGHGRIPPLNAYLDEDGSVLIKWSIGDFRIGFNIEPNIADSGWHMISNKNTFSGQLKDNKQMIGRLLDVIIKSI